MRVFDHDEFLCKAVNQDHHYQEVSLTEIQATRDARRRALRAGIKSRAGRAGEAGTRRTDPCTSWGRVGIPRLLAGEEVKPI